MITCPKCGYQNVSDAMNCAGCHVNLQFALSHAQEWKDEEEEQARQKQLLEKISSLLVTTTPTLEGKTIGAYLGIVSTVIVLGAGPLSEINADIADLFGTRAGDFQKKLSQATNAALQEIKEQAVRCGGDAIVGLDLDYQITSKNMLMVSVSGTAVTCS